jgi:hypothetical protein
MSKLRPYVGSMRLRSSHSTLDSGPNAFDRKAGLSSLVAVNVDDIRKRLEGRFVPFKLRTSDGWEVRVPHPEFIFVTPKRVVVADRKGYVNVLDPLHIVSIEEGRQLPAS